MNWKEQWIDEVLRKVPEGSCRERMESELRDHLETQYCALLESGRTESEAQAETLRTMGEPEELQKEYRAVWRQTLPELLEEWGYRLRSWAVAFVAMIAVHFLASCVMGIVGIVDNSSWLWSLIPLVYALMVGAYYLSGRFQTLRRPAWQISVGLSFYWVFIAAGQVWWEAIDDHRTFWEELKDYFSYQTWVRYYSFILVFCILLGVVFERMDAKKSSAA